MKIDRQAIYERDGGLCGFCGQPVPWDLLHLDHIVPRGLGGHTASDNLRVAHRKCNISAGLEVRLERARQGLPPMARYHRMVLNVSVELAEQLIQIAERERRPLGTQIQVLVERGLMLIERDRLLKTQSKAVVAA